MPTECRIRVLEEEVANKIAAGEVVERPFSVVKELVENAVDAGATRITVEVEDGGKRLIRVSDNGCGMTAQEAVLALQRHATSKISRAEDLASVRSLGFRGEALPSVASVSRLTLVTRPRGGLEGIRLEAEAGEIRELEPAAAAEGSVITVRDLFYNTPARLKFLKTTRTELAQICDALSRLALSQPGIAVRLSSEGEEILHSPGSPEPLNTVVALYGGDVARELVPVAHSRPGLAVEGYVSRPTYTRPTRSGQVFFVNGRWVRNRTLTHALDEAFRSTMPPGRFPFALIHVEIDPALVDVNVHPTKSEVRFLRDWEVHRAVFEAIREALGAPGPLIPSEGLARRQTLTPEEVQHGPWLPPQPGAADPFAGADPGASAAAAPGTTAAAPAVQPALPELRAPARTLRPVAQLWNSYIVAEGPSGLLVIDQHLAHERVLFDRMRAEAAEGAGSSGGTQRLEPPATLQLGHREALAASDLLPELARAGFELEPFGKDAFVLRAAPRFVPAAGAAALLRQLLDQLIEDRRSGGEAKVGVPERIAAGAACRAAVKKGAPLGREEMAQLLRDLEAATDPHTCPHGCPIAIEISYQELLKRFKRI
ncbi:MAG: DNA mismatch repair endonuclease MutL [Armatimonadota bacterium]